LCGREILYRDLKAELFIGANTIQIEARDSLIDPEDHGCGDAYSGHEGVGAPIISGVDTPPVFEPAEHDLGDHCSKPLS
jgi:hypothetical protein